MLPRGLSLRPQPTDMVLPNKLQPQPTDLILPNKLTLAPQPIETLTTAETSDAGAGSEGAGGSPVKKRVRYQVTPMHSPKKVQEKWLSSLRRKKHSESPQPRLKK